MLLSPCGIYCINLGKSLNERFKRQQATGHAQVVPIGDKRRAHDQTDDGPAQGRATEAEIGRHLNGEVYASTAGISIAMTGNSETKTAIRPSMPRSDGPPIARNVNCIYIPDVRLYGHRRVPGEAYTKWTRILQNLAWGCWLADHRCSHFQLPLVYFPR